MQPQTTSKEVPSEVPETTKKSRHRKKHLYSSILNQMEFYFSDSNLSKDRFLAQKVQENPYIELETFLIFNKIRKLTGKIEDIRNAVKNSQLLQLSEDGNSIKRATEVKEKLNVENCTIYLEKLKTDATHEWITSVFAEFGTVVYVSIPKYKSSGANKGFAFVEFDKEEEAQKALDYFQSIGAKIPSHIEPHQLASVVTSEDLTEEQPEETTNKRKLDEDEDESIGKKVKAEQAAEKAEQATEKAEEATEKAEEATEKAEEATEKAEQATEKAEQATEVEDAEKRKKKLKKDNKKKNYMKELGIQVLSKYEWRRMRNKYMDLQRKKMKEFKKHLGRVKCSQANYEEKVKKQAEKTPEETPNKLEFIPGVIVKLNLEEPCPDPKKFKSELRTANPEMKYVDVPNPGSLEIYARFISNDSAKTFIAKETNLAYNPSILEEEDEKTYWSKLYETREIKLQRTNNKMRGRDKLLKKANKVMASHIKFEE